MKGTDEKVHKRNYINKRRRNERTKETEEMKETKHERKERNKKKEIISRRKGARQIVGTKVFIDFRSGRKKLRKFNSGFGLKRK